MSVQVQLFLSKVFYCTSCNIKLLYRVVVQAYFYRTYKLNALVNNVLHEEVIKLCFSRGACFLERKSLKLKGFSVTC